MSHFQQIWTWDWNSQSDSRDSRDFLEDVASDNVDHEGESTIGIGHSTNKGLE